MSSLNELLETSASSSGSKDAWNKFAPGHTSHVTLVSDLEGNPKNLPEMEVVKFYKVEPDYLSEKEKQFGGANYGRTVYYYDGDPLHPGHVKWWNKHKKVFDEDVIRKYIRRYGIVAYVFNIDAYYALRRSETEPIGNLAPWERFYTKLFEGSKGSGNTAEDDDFNGILTYEMHKGFADQVIEFYESVKQSGRNDWISHYLWKVSRSKDDNKYSIARVSKVGKLPEDYLEEYPQIDVDAIKEAAAKAASEELALPPLSMIIDRKRYTPEEAGELGEEYSFKNAKEEFGDEDDSDEPIHVTTGRGETVEDDEWGDDNW
jgi:hypothetical protein